MSLRLQGGAASSGSGIAETLLDAKGDLIAASAADTAARVAVGANGYVLTAQSGQAAGLLWVSPAIEAWIDVTVFTGSWVNIGAPYANTRYAKSPAGLVVVEIAMKTGSNVAAFTLPGGYLPSHPLWFPARSIVSGTATLGFTQIAANGVVTGIGGTGPTEYQCVCVYPADG